VDVVVSAHPAGPSPLDATWFRQVLGQYPTGVTVVTAIGQDGKPVGLAVGSFTSVSLDPPLVAFLPDKTSSSWPKIEPVGRFCVNIIGAHQEAVSRRFATKLPDKFEGLPWRPGPSGAPIIEGVVAWIDCDLEAVYEAGDHYIVLGRVGDLAVETPTLPLIFFQGGYGRFHPLSVVARDADMAGPLRVADLARRELEAVARELDGQCVAAGLLDGEIALLASAGDPARALLPPTLVGTRVEALPPLGGLWMAYAADAVVEPWLRHVPSAEDRSDLRRRLARIRERGYSVGLESADHEEWERIVDQQRLGHVTPPTRAELLDLAGRLPYDPEDFSPDDAARVRSIHAPVFAADGTVALVLNAFGFEPAADADGFLRQVGVLKDAADRVTARSGGGSA
jgi:flavin reductase (DIM6/NTAB) family NADH-FMN oxidoreductase RutF/DNA-binding IclR family transcriptional regulator